MSIFIQNDYVFVVVNKHLLKLSARDRGKTRHISVDTEPRLRHEKPCLETRQVS